MQIMLPSMSCRSFKPGNLCKTEKSKSFNDFQVIVMIYEVMKYFVYLKYYHRFNCELFKVCLILYFIGY